MVNYKVFKVVVKVGSKLTPLASVNEDMELDWHDENVASADVKTALMPAENLQKEMAFRHFWVW